MGRWVGILSGCLATTACGCTDDEVPSALHVRLTADELLEPEQCSSCHPDQFREWSGSMHAYAAEDPVFLAMNARGQRETGGALGDFCVKCHAPMALRTGATTDGLDLGELPAKVRGVTCYFCHSVAAVSGTHNSPLDLATDGVLRGAFGDPVPNGAHDAAYSPLFDRDRSESASVCGSCHDIVTNRGAHIERTFAEWKGTLFAHQPGAVTCSRCHMVGRDGLAAQAPGVPLRRIHSHAFPAVDLALGDFPEADAQRQAVERALDITLQAELCVRGANRPGATTVQVVVDNVGAGHAWPSGAAQDRRAWAEVVAYKGSDVVYQSGVVPEGASVTESPDPDLWLIRDCMFDDRGSPVHMFWEAASVDGNQLPGPITKVQTDPAYYLTHVGRTFPRPTSTPPALPVAPDRVTLKVFLVPVGLDVLDDLIGSGDLDPSVKGKMPRFSLGGAELEWTPASATIEYLDDGFPVSCVSSGITTPAGSANPAKVSSCVP